MSVIDRDFSLCRRLGKRADIAPPRSLLVVVITMAVRYGVSYPVRTNLLLRDWSMVVMMSVIFL